MGRIEYICEKFNQPQEEVESDLYSILMEVSKGEKSKIMDHSYKQTLRMFLIEKRCIIDHEVYYEITEEGKRLLLRGWITRDYKSLNDKEKKDNSIKYWTLGASITTAIATLLTAVITILKNF